MPAEALSYLQGLPFYQSQVAHVKHFPPSHAAYGQIKQPLPPPLQDAIRAKGTGGRAAMSNHQDTMSPTLSSWYPDQDIIMGLTTSPSLSRLLVCQACPSSSCTRPRPSTPCSTASPSPTNTTTPTAPPHHAIHFTQSAAGRSLACVILLPPAGQHLCLCTATSSGKSLVYTLPVLATLLTTGGRALFLFPTKVPPSLRPHASPAYPLALACRSTA